MREIAETQRGTNFLEYPLLNIMDASQSPLGACALVEMLEEIGIKISEAGIGRALRQFRQKGLLERKGFQGHVITEAGKTRLLELSKTRKMGETLQELMPQPLEDRNVLDILIARRALEREAAYQAALNATPEDIARLEDIIRAQYLGMERNESYSDLSTGFHREIMSIARAPLLKSLYELIGLSVQWQDFFIGTFKLYNQPLNASHEKIFHAIRDHNPEKAAHLMGMHLSDVINYASQLLNLRK